MKKSSLILAAVVVSSTFLGLMAGAQTAPAPVAPVATKPASTGGSAVSDFEAAMSTAAWARANKSPEGLALASRMLAGVPVKPMDKPAKETEGKADPAAPAKTAADVTAASLLAEAKALAGSDKDALAAVDRIGKVAAAPRGNTRGALLHADVVRAGVTDRYTIAFTGGDLAVVGVSGDGTTDLDLYVYDDAGNLIVSDTDYTDECLVSFIPRRTGQFIIRIVNRGSVWNAYTLGTN